MPNSEASEHLNYLGTDTREFDGLDTIPCPRGVTETTYWSDEVTANCPVTSQPDWYVVSITLGFPTRLPESKSLKLYLQSFRDAGIFAEAFAAEIAAEMQEATDAQTVNVTVHQKPRGGIRIAATAHSSITAPITGGNVEGSS